MNALNTSNPNNFQYKTQHLTIQVLGGVRITKLESLRVTLAVGKPKSSNILRHSIDLYNDNHVEKFVRRCAERLEIGTSIVRKNIQGLTRELENYRFVLLDKQYQDDAPFEKELTPTEKRTAIGFLKKKNLLEITNQYIGKSGVIGEEKNRLLMYLIFTSRKMNNPLHCISFGSSGVGKTHLQSKVAELIPEADRLEITVLSANAFYYFNRTELQHKLILIEDMDGAESVLYPLRELQSKKRITKTVVHKDTKGTTKTIHLTVEGPVSVAGCTTQERIYEDNSNRSFLLYIDESPEQDERIMNYQRTVSAGQVNHDEQSEAMRLLRNVQRVLKPIKVVNPYVVSSIMTGGIYGKADSPPDENGMVFIRFYLQKAFKKKENFNSFLTDYLTSPLLSTLDSNPDYNPFNGQVLTPEWFDSTVGGVSVYEGATGKQVISKLLGKFLAKRFYAAMGGIWLGNKYRKHWDHSGRTINFTLYSKGE